jgi:hypothetical protein
MAPHGRRNWIEPSISVLYHSAKWILIGPHLINIASSDPLVHAYFLTLRFTTHDEWPLSCWKRESYCYLPGFRVCDIPIRLDILSWVINALSIKHSFDVNRCRDIHIFLSILQWSCMDKNLGIVYPLYMSTTCLTYPLSCRLGHYCNVLQLYTLTTPYTFPVSLILLQLA